MNTDFLRSLVMVADAGSMAEASRRLDLTPTAVAQQIRALERELGITLLARTGRAVSLTEAGHRVLQRARMLLRDVQALQSESSEETSGELRFGSINTALHNMVPAMLAQLIRTYPNVKVFLQPSASAELYEAVHEGAIDMAVCLQPQFVLPKTCEWRLLREERLIVLAPPKFAHRDPNDLLANEPLIRYNRNIWGGRQADRYLRQEGIVCKERFEITSLTAIAVMVAHGLGVSLVPDVESPWKDSLSVARIPLPAHVEPRRVGALWLRSSTRLRLINYLVDVAAPMS